MKKILLSFAFIAGMAGLSHAQCDAVASFDENFDAFTTFPENCWTGNGIPGMTFGIQDDEDGGKEILFYGFTTVGSEYYLVAPELTTIDGSHYLTFDGQAVSALGMGLKVQIGTLESNTDFGSFVAHGDEITISSTELISFESINIPAGESHKFVAVRFTTSAGHQSLRLDNFKWNATEAPCEALSTINEGFDDFTAFPQNCWSASSGYPFIMFDAGEDNTVTFYALSAADNHYIATPELTTINGEYRLRFKAARGGVPGAINVQVGTLSDNSDFTTFVAHGEELAITATDETEYVSISIPATSGHKYVALRFKATGDHQSLTIDDIVWEEQPSTGTDGFNQITHSLYPNPVSDILTVQSEIDIKNVVVYDITGKIVMALTPSAKIFTIDVQQINSGIYFIQLRSDNKTSVSRFVKN